MWTHRNISIAALYGRLHGVRRRFGEALREHYACLRAVPGDAPLSGLEDFLATMTLDPELVRGCDVCLDLMAEDLKDHNEYRGRCLHCRQEIHAQGGTA